MRDLDVWLVFYDEIVDARLLSRLCELLTREEREQQQRFHFADDRKRALITRALVRTVLSRYEAIAPADWLFAENHYGRPEIANFGNRGCDLTFNVSHTRGVIALAVARGRALGIDIENVAARPVSIEVAERFFAASETADLLRVPSACQQDRFFEYWTFKESYIKARGMGLSLPLDQFSFDYPHDAGVRLTIQPTLADDANRWSFWQFRPGSEYQLALCAERFGNTVPHITLRKVIPTVRYELLDLSAVRTSA
jgi:4'-phosphopantetheinyl transferase